MDTPNARFKQTRTTHGLTQAQFAEMLGISLESVRKVEQEKIDVSSANALLLHKKFGVSLDWLFLGAETKPAEIQLNTVADVIKVLLQLRKLPGFNFKNELMPGNWPRTVLDLPCDLISEDGEMRKASYIAKFFYDYNNIRRVCSNIDYGDELFKTWQEKQLHDFDKIRICDDLHAPELLDLLGVDDGSLPF